MAVVLEPTECRHNYAHTRPHWGTQRNLLSRSRTVPSTLNRRFTLPLPSTHQSPTWFYMILQWIRFSQVL